MMLIGVIVPKVAGNDPFDGLVLAAVPKNVDMAEFNAVKYVGPLADP